MSAPLIWIGFPILSSILLFSFRAFRSWVSIVGSFIALLLSIFALVAPIGTDFSIGPFIIQLNSTIFISGRRLVVEQADRYLLFVIYLAASIWFIGVLITRSNHLFVPVGLGIVALLVGALSIDPFLFGALLYEIVILLSIPVLVPPGSKVGKGILRFLSFQSLGIPFILFTGWMLTGVESLPVELELAVQSAVLMGFGFALLLAVFPFHSWIPMLVLDANPYVVSFFMFSLPGVIAIFGLGFIDQFSWLRDSNSVYAMVRAAGLIMVFTGGLWIIFQNNFGRIFGFAVIIETGFSLLAIGLGNQTGYIVFLGSLLPRMLCYFLWGLALHEIYTQYRNLDFSVVSGAIKIMPFAAAGLLCAQFSVAGYPLFAEFPYRLSLMIELGLNFPVFAAGALFGSLGLIFSAWRSLMALITLSDTPNNFNKLKVSNKYIYLLGIFIIILIGIYPKIILMILDLTPSPYPNLTN